jgi:hypothetical protein
MTPKTLHVFGDSFVVGIQHKTENIFPSYITSHYEKVDYLKYNISFSSILAKHFNYKLINYAEEASGNLPQIDLLFSNIDKIQKDDLIMFGLTSTNRDRASVLEFKEFHDRKEGQKIVHKSSLELDSLAITDFYYILSILESIEKRFDLKIIKFNLFHNPLYKNFNPIFNFNNFIDINKPCNTLVDMLVGNYDGIEPILTKDIPRPAQNVFETLDTEQKQFFCIDMHPNKLGHIKIAQWLKEKIEEMNISW